MKHRTALVSAMSIAGVVLAGATALGANLGILNSSQGLGEISTVEPVATPSTSTTVSTMPGTPQSDLVAYQINGVGVVTIAREGSDLTLGSADVGSWTYEVTSQGEKLAVAFRFEDRQVDFEAQVTEGQVVVDVWEDKVVVQSGGNGGSSPVATQPPTSVTSAPTRDDDTHEDDDSYDDDGYDDDGYDSDDSYDDSPDSPDDSYEDDDDGSEDDD